MNILQLINKVPFPANDGGSIAALNVSDSFIDSGNKVTILAMNTSKHHMTPEELMRHDQKNLKVICVDVNTDLSIYKALKNYCFSNLPYNAERFFSIDFKNKLIELLKHNSYDIVQLEGLYTGMYIPVIRQYSDALISLRAHNLEHEIWERIAGDENSYLKKKYLNIISRRVKQLESKTINMSDVLVPITERDAASFAGLGCTIPMHVSPSGININEFPAPGQPADFPSLFYIGALDWVPNQQGLIWFFEHVWEILLSNIKDIKLYIAGRNAPSWLINYITRKKAIYAGEVKNAHDFMKSKSIMIVPLRSGSGMRIKIIEGMALGKAIVTTSIGTEGIKSSHNKNILIADAPVDFAYEIEKCFKNKELCNDLGLNAYRFVIDNYNNSTIYSLLLNFYNSEINNKNRSKSFV